MKTSGELFYRELESGGYEVLEDWWAEDQSLANGWACKLNDGSASLTQNGRVILRGGFRNDGGSFIAIDTTNALAGYMAHDALYRMMRQSKLPNVWRGRADKFMRTLHELRGVSFFRRWWLWVGVRVGASKHAKPQADKEKIVHAA